MYRSHLVYMSGFATGLGHLRTGAIACEVMAVGMGVMPHLAALAL